MEQSSACRHRPVGQFGESVRLIICETVSDVAESVVGIIEKVASGVASPRIGVAAGATFEPVYGLMAPCANRRVRFASASFFLLDEYLGVSDESPNSFHHFIRSRLAHRLGVSPGRVHGPNGLAPDPSAESTRYEEALLAAPIDLQLLGIGLNGHIGFNEPGSSLASRTRPVRLSRLTRRTNASHFQAPEDVPQRAITQGVGTIMRAGAIVLMATGRRKAPAVARAVEGPVSSAVPASALQLHTDTTYVLDEPAASELTFSLELRE